MNRDRTIAIAALNIAMHKPHSPQRYVDLFVETFKQRRYIAQGELHTLLLGTVHDTQNAVEKDIVTGEIYRCVKIDASQPWFDENTGKPATDEVLESIHIPGHLMAHFQVIPFVFYPKSHELWYVCKDRKSTLAPLAAERFFQSLFDYMVALHNYPVIAVTAIPDTSAVDELLSWPTLSSVAMHIKRPNADDGVDWEERLEAMMAEQNLKSFTQEMTAASGESIEPSEETKAMARAVAKNGSVSVTGIKADGTKGAESTVKKPMKLFRKVMEKTETVMHVLKRARDDRRR